ncbi:MAG: HD-GYP domain-containing protein [Lysobacterales bacterium]
MEIVEVRKDVRLLKVGMYVCRLDRPWLDTPYEMEGFLIQSDEDLQELAKHCSYVFIDDRRSVYAGQRKRMDFGFLAPLGKPHAIARLERFGFRQMRGLDRPPVYPVEYAESIELAKELPRAANAWKKARTMVSQIIARAKVGKPFDPEEVMDSVEYVVDSVVRSPDATMWLSTIHRQANYVISHPLNCCALVLVFARYLGFPPEILLSMAKGALLMDIGMWRLNQNFYINRNALDEASLEEVHEHVVRGLDYLESCGFLDVDARLMILHHHERYDDAGYPRQVRGAKVSLMGYMLGLADAFDAICSRRSYRDEGTILDAQRELLKQRDLAFPGELVEAFLQCLGVYPTGSFVELSTGEIAAVSGQQVDSRLYPRLILLTNADRSTRSEFVEVDSRKLVTADPPVKIVRSVLRSSVKVPLDRIELMNREETEA